MTYETYSITEGTAALKAGLIVAYPTESVFGIGCDPKNPIAVERLRRIKNRPAKKGFLLVAGNLSHVSEYAQIENLPVDMQSLVYASWPGPHTWVFPKFELSFPWVAGEESGIAIRVTAHPIAAALSLDFGGALISTSANRSGDAAAQDAEAVWSIFQGDVDLIIRGEIGRGTRPSFIRNATTGEVIRA